MEYMLSSSSLSLCSLPLLCPFPFSSCSSIFFLRAWPTHLQLFQCILQATYVQLLRLQIVHVQRIQRYFNPGHQFQWHGIQNAIRHCRLQIKYVSKLQVSWVLSACPTHLQFEEHIVCLHDGQQLIEVWLELQSTRVLSTWCIEYGLHVIQFHQTFAQLIFGHQATAERIHNELLQLIYALGDVLGNLKLFAEWVNLSLPLSLLLSNTHQIAILVRLHVIAQHQLCAIFRSAEYVQRFGKHNLKAEAKQKSNELWPQGITRLRSNSPHPIHAIPYRI